MLQICQFETSQQFLLCRLQSSNSKDYRLHLSSQMNSMSIRSDSEAYAHKLIEVGVTLTATRYLGTTHEFVTLNVLVDTPAAREAINQAYDILKKALSDQ